MKEEPDDDLDPVPEPIPQEILLRARDLIQSVKGFAHFKTSYRRKINSAATLPEGFYQFGAGALDTNDWLASTAQITGTDVREALDFSREVVILAGELELLAKGLRGTAAVRVGTVGERLLFAYTVARRHNRTAGAKPIPHIYEMEAILRARRRRGGKVEEPEALEQPEEAG